LELDYFLTAISSEAGVSGHEHALAELLKKEFGKWADSVETDKIGNLVAFKKGSDNSSSLQILLAAHMDEIGLMVTKIEKEGFLRFTTVGGIDPRTLLGQEVTVHGREQVWGVIGVLPPHINKLWPAKDKVEIEDLLIDTGLQEDALKKVVRIGDVISIKREPLRLLGNNLAGKALDDRAGVAALLVCLKKLNKVKHTSDVFLTMTSQEEVGTRGAVVAGYRLEPDFAVAVDVCHGNFPGAQEHEVSPLGAGPVISIGPNIHPRVEKILEKAAEKHRIPFNVDVFPGPTPTDARAFQISKTGIPTGLVSIPLRYMHTSVEVVNTKDIELAGELLAAFVCSFPDALKEDSYA